jgi:hypothetical protein
MFPRKSTLRKISLPSDEFVKQKLAAQNRALAISEKYPKKPEFSADHRFVRGPYSKFAYPYSVYYPGMVQRVKVRYGQPVSSRASRGRPCAVPKPYVFQHYIPPTYVETWDYNKQDHTESMYNEALRKQVAATLIPTPTLKITFD